MLYLDKKKMEKSNLMFRSFSSNNENSITNFLKHKTKKKSNKIFPKEIFNKKIWKKNFFVIIFYVKLFAEKLKYQNRRRKLEKLNNYHFNLISDLSEAPKQLSIDWKLKKKLEFERMLQISHTNKKRIFFLKIKFGNYSIFFSFLRINLNFN